MAAAPRPAAEAEARAVSVIVVSRGRPAELLRCLSGLERLDHPPFEVVVVADAAGRAAAAAHPLGPGLKIVPCEVPNISLARNLGLAAAGGEIVAFIDDDAVPETRWLLLLTAPFAAPDVAATGGYVRGPDGIRHQWRAREVLADGTHRPLEPGEGPSRHPGRPGRAVRTEGTNMAFRRSVIAAAGGFDPAFAFYLDETDLNLRLAAAGAVTVLVPQAEVHHGYAASGRRRADRVPRDLRDIGASLAVLHRRHLGRTEPARLAAEMEERRRSLIAHMIAGRIEPREVGALLATLAAGWAEGSVRPLPDLRPLPAPTAPFRPAAGGAPRRQVVLWGPRRARARLLAEARAAARSGLLPTLFLLGPGRSRHRAAFLPEGIWLHEGGVAGRSDGPLPIPAGRGLAPRVAQELARLVPQRWAEPPGD